MKLKRRHEQKRSSMKRIKISAQDMTSSHSTLLRLKAILSFSKFLYVNCFFLSSTLISQTSCVLSTLFFSNSSLKLNASSFSLLFIVTLLVRLASSRSNSHFVVYRNSTQKTIIRTQHFRSISVSEASNSSFARSFVIFKSRTSLT